MRRPLRALEELRARRRRGSAHGLTLAPTPSSSAQMKRTADKMGDGGAGAGTDSRIAKVRTAAAR